MNTQRIVVLLCILAFVPVLVGAETPAEGGIGFTTDDGDSGSDWFNWPYRPLFLDHDRRSGEQYGDPCDYQTCGDINFNGVAYEVADAVLFSNYFINGTDVFCEDLAGQIGATDVNGDGKTLTLPDFVYLVRVVVGYAYPYPPTRPVATWIEEHQGVYYTSHELGAAYLTVTGNIIPTLLAENMSLKYAYDAVENITRVLVYSLQAEGFTGEFVSVSGAVHSLELSSYDGAPVVIRIRRAVFLLMQNYPNPFNATTHIAFAAPVATDYSLTIYNLTGQVVRVFTGHVEPGFWICTWEAGRLASGIYLYRLEAGSFTETKTMILLK